MSKFVDHLPLYRQERIFSRQGVELTRTTMCGWMAACAQSLKPLYDLMVTQVLLSKGDSTALQSTSGRARWFAVAW